MAQQQALLATGICKMALAVSFSWRPLVVLDGEFFVVVLPGGEDEQLTASNG